MNAYAVMIEIITKQDKIYKKRRKLDNNSIFWGKLTFKFRFST